MKIVTGRGKRRSVFELPCSEIVKAAPEQDQRQATAVVCELLSIK